MNKNDLYDGFMTCSHTKLKLHAKLHRKYNYCHGDPNNNRHLSKSRQSSVLSTLCTKMYCEGKQELWFSTN